MESSPARDPLIGTVLEGQFHVERVIGNGGMGRVYVAESRRLKRRCALKVLLPELAKDEGCVERFLREAQAIAQIQHANVVDIHHLGEDPSGIVFFAMELLSGEDLAARLRDREQRPIGWRTIAAWMLQVAGAMVAVHAAGLIHRDLKPSNVFIARRPDGSEQIKLRDFGIVKGDDHPTLTGTGTVIGTASYMSPEQVQGDPIDRRSDIYSFGVLFYEALAGRKPFVGEPVRVAYQHCHTPPPPLGPIAAEIPPELEQLVMGMLTKSVSARIQTVEVVEQTLQEILARASMVATTPATRVREASPPAPSIARAPVVELSPAPRVTPQNSAPRVVNPSLTTAVRPTTTSLLWSILLIGVCVLAVIVILISLEVGRPAPRDSGEKPPVTSPAPARPANVTPPSAPEPPVVVSSPPGEEPASTPGVESTAPAVKVAKKQGSRPVKPRLRASPEDVELRRGAAECRKKHGDAPPRKIKYAIGNDGVVTSATSTLDGPLDDCLEAILEGMVFTATGEMHLENITL